MMRKTLLTARTSMLVVMLVSFSILSVQVAKAFPAENVPTAPDPLAGVLTAMYNAEYDEAQSALRLWLQSHPSDFRAWNYLAKSILDREMLRESLFSGSAYLNNGEAFQKRTEPLPKGFEERLNAALSKAESLETAQLRENPKDEEALFWLGTTYATRAEYEFALLRSYFSALREGKLAWKTNVRLLKLNPHFTDAYFIVGIAEYAVALLPWYAKIVTSIAGIHGNRKRGIADLKRVSEEGHYARVDAQIVLVAIYERERNYTDALALLKPLGEAYPENFLAPLEMGRIYGEEGNWAEAVRIYDGAVKKFVRGKENSSRVPVALILYRAGHAHERMGETDEALTLYGEAANDPSKSLMGYRAEMAAADMERRLNRFDAARKSYQRVMDAVPNTDLGQAAREALTELRGKE